MSTSTYQVTGMSCAHCEQAIRSELLNLDGIDAVDVDASTGRLVITASNPLDDQQVLDAVEEAGYEAVRA